MLLKVKGMNIKSEKSQLILFFIISYGYLWILFGIGKLAGISFSYDIREPGGILVVAGVPASFFAAGFVTLITQGKTDLHKLFTRSLNWRFNPIWYLSALLAPLLVAAVCTAAAIWINGAKIPQKWFSPAMPPGFMVFLLIYIGFGEEIGWRGFALPRFQRCLGSIRGSVATGLFWALWHLPLFLMPGSSQYGHSVTVFIYLLVCWTIPMAVFVGKARGSVLPAVLFHISVNFLAFSVYYPYRYFYLIWGIAAVISIPFLPRPLAGSRKQWY